MRDNLASKKMSSQPKLDLAVGGQAVLEGVMMRAPERIVVAVRNPQGQIKLKQDPFRAFINKYKFLNLPILRGMINMLEMLIVGTRALNWSAKVALEEEDKTASWKDTLFSVLGLLLGLVLAIGIFKFVPLLLATYLAVIVHTIDANWLLFNAVDGVVKIILLLGYLYLIGFWSDLRRVFAYHGAEHKVIFTYEKGEELNVTNAKKNSRFHPRCGTSFLIIVCVMSIFFYTFLPKAPSFWLNFGNRLLVLPLIAGVSYEFLKLTGKYRDQAWARTLSLPGLWTQRLTTREPDDTQLEVALTALREATKD